MKVLQKMSLTKKEEKLHSSMYLIFVVLIVDLLGFTVILPLFPSIFEYYSSNKEDYLYQRIEEYVQHIQNVFGFSDEFNKVLYGGILGSLFCTLQFLVSPLFGSLSDVYGRKPILIITMIGNAISHMVWCQASYFYLFIIARIIGGFSRANITLMIAVTTDLCPENKRGKGMALIGIGFSISFIVGPFIGALFATRAAAHDQNFFFLPAVFAVTTCLIAVLILLLFFKESLPENKRASSIGQGLNEAYQLISPPSLFSFSPVVDISHKEKHVLKKIGAIYFLFMFIYSGLEYSLSFLTHQRFGFSRMQQGRMYVFSGIIMILIQGGYTRRIPPGKEIKCAAFGVLLVIPAFIIIGITENIYALGLGIALYAFASATVVPCLTTVASKCGSSSQKGIIVGIFRSIGSLARALGPLIFALAYWIFTPQVSYTVGGLLLAVPLFLIVRLSRDLKSHEKNK